MKKDVIQETVDNHFIDIERSFQKTTDHFNINDIQQFRIEIKKLQAFFHLLDMEAKRGSEFKITPKMKTFYGYTGTINNLHLLLRILYDHFEYATGKDLAPLISKLEKEISYWENTAKEFVDPHKIFHPDEKKILARLPKKLRRRSVKKFSRNMGYEVQTFLTRFDDDKINSIGKLLEDILYNWQFIQPYADKLPEGLRKEDELRPLVTSLSRFRDQCAVNTLLDTCYNDAETDDEKVVLANVIHFGKTQKDDLKKAICSKLELVHVQPIIKRAFSL